MSKAKTVNPVSFNWAKASPLYTLNGGTAVYNAGGPDQYRPVVGDLAMAPDTGRYFYEIRINCDNTRVGLSTDSIDLTGEMGKIADCVSLNVQTGAVEINGIETKRLWRLVAAISGGVMGFVYDSAEGTLQIYFNMEFMGTAVGPECGLKGKVLYPCCGVAGVELNNRNIGVGKKSLVVLPNPEPYYTLV